ncbi:MAG: SET domain-containing protein [Bacteroidetes bacterium]|nr:SET domain-containing protein [Bacteroidota bacterium]
MIHPDTEVRFINEIIGYGVVAKKPIPKGTITWIQDPLDRVFEPDEIEKFDLPVRQLIDTYCFRNNKGAFVLCWDIAKYVNHSFHANCLSTPYDFEIAIRDIEAGEQLTDDYGYLNVSEPFAAFDEGADRKVVYPDDLLRYHPVWDQKISAVFGLIPHQKQPLRNFFTAEKWEHVEDILKGNKRLDSILACYYPNGQQKSE